jgi:hypothetical protein
VALSANDKRHHANLIQAAETLREVGKPKLAESIDFVLGPKGNGFTTRLRQDLAGTELARTPNLPIRMLKSDRDVIQQTKSASLTSILNDGFRRFLAGEFEVRKEPRRRVSESNPTLVLNAAPDGELHADVARRCRELKEAGQRPVLAVSNVAAAILYDHFSLGAYAPDGEAAVHRETIQLYLREEYWATVDDAGLSTKELTDIVEDGLRRFVDGSLDLQVESRPVGKKGELTSGRVLKLQVAPELLAEAGALFKRVKAERGFPGYTGTSTFIAATLFAHFEIGPYAPENTGTE